MAFIPDTPAALKFVPDAPVASAAPARVGGLEENLLGPTEVLGSAAANIPGGIVNSVNDLAHKLTLGAFNPGRVPSVPTGAAGTQLMGDIANLPGVKQVLDAGTTADAALKQAHPAVHAAAHTAADMSGDLLNVLPAGGALRAAADIPEALAASRAATSAPITNIEDQLSAVGYPRLPSKNPNASALERAGGSAVGESTLTGPQSLTSQAVSNRLAQHEAEIPPNKELNADNAAAARAAGPGKVYDAARAALPERLVQDPTLQSKIAGVGDTTSQLPKSPDVDALKQAMLEQPNMTRDELFQNISQARDRASRFYASDQPDAHAIGDAYQGIANAYEDFVGRQLAATHNSPVSLSDWQAARARFAKSYAVQGALDGPNINAAKLSTLGQKEPGLLTGGLRLIAEQEARYPLSTGFGPRTLPDTGMGASGSIPGQITRHLTGPLVGGGLGYLMGGAGGAALGSGAGELISTGFQNLIRRALSGTPEKGAAAANGALTDPRLSDLFDPQPPAPAAPGPLTLQPPPGRAFEPHQPALATATGERNFFGTGANAVPPAGPMGAPAAAAEHPGQLSLMDLLSHGVEQTPEAGLTAGPMGAPAPEGIPFTRNAAHEAGDLETHEPTLMELLENLKDHPDVMSQGVPEGIMSRTANNASGESPASLEAINRTTREHAQGQDRFLIDQDGKMWPIRGVEAADATAPRGSIIVQKGIGGEPYSILDRGGLPRAHAHGLLNRALAGGHGMTLMDLLGDNGG